MVSSVFRSSHPSQRFLPLDKSISKARLTKKSKHIEYVRRLVKELKQIECMRRLNKNPNHTDHMRRLSKKHMEYIQGLSEKLKRREFMRRLAHFFEKWENSTEETKGCHLDATSEFSFIPLSRPHSVVSAPPVLGITPEMHQMRPIMRTRRVRPQPNSSRSVIAFLNCLRTGLIFLWSVFTLFVVVYTGARCYEQGSSEFLINSLEGALMLGFLIVAFISAVIMFIMFKKYGREIRGELHPDECFDAGFELSTYL